LFQQAKPDHPFIVANCRFLVHRGAIRETTDTLRRWSHLISKVCFWHGDTSANQHESLVATAIFGKGNKSTKSIIVFAVLSISMLIRIDLD